jgi:hypothetical protein
MKAFTSNIPKYEMARSRAWALFGRRLCRLWDPTAEGGADNAGERNHRQHGDEPRAVQAVGRVICYQRRSKPVFSRSKNLIRDGR